MRRPLSTTAAPCLRQHLGKSPAEPARCPGDQGTRPESSMVYAMSILEKKAQQAVRRFLADCLALMTQW
jgi:hypothetical protein